MKKSMVVAVALFAAQVAYAAQTTVTRAPWGKEASGAAVELFTIISGKAEVKVATYGARLVSIRVPNRNGQMGNILVGPDTLEGFLDNRTSVMGATIGRYANRIAGGEFSLNGTTYSVPKNNNGNALHGGTIGFDRKVWRAKIVSDGVEMTLVSPDGDMGFPGTLTVHVSFTLAARNGDPALTISYSAETDKPTVLNLTNHAYFNLADDSSTSVFGDYAKIDADTYTPVNASSIPTGAIDPVQGTPYDFRAMHEIGAQAPPRGYDNNFVLHAHGLEEAAAEVDDPASGRTVEVFTTEPGLQFYVPRMPGPPAGSAGATTRPALAAFCLEAEHFPDSPNHPSFPSTVLLPGKPYHATTIYVFEVSKK